MKNSAAVQSGYVEVQCVRHDLKSGYAVVYSSESSELVTARFIPKSEETFRLTTFELYDWQEEQSRIKQTLTLAIFKKPPTEYSFRIPVETTTKYYDARFQIISEDLTLSVQLPIVVFHLDKDLKSLEPVEPYKPLKLPKLTNNTCHIINVPPSERYSRPKTNFNNVSIIVNNYKTDSRLRDLRKDSILANCPVLNHQLTASNYVEKFKLLIDLCLRAEHEDVNRMLNSNYKIHFVKEGVSTDTFLFKIYTDNLYLNSFIYVQEIKDEQTSSECFQGIIKDFDSDSATLEFPKGFLQIFHPDKSFFLRHEASQYNSALMHRSLNMVDQENITAVIFPKKIKYSHGNLIKLDLFNEQMEDNEEQKRAVHQILSEDNQRVPYIVFGPPGTGKTTTILEAIKQVYTMKKGCKILVCAPFNKHVDEITMKLMDFIPKENHKTTLHRLYASGYIPSDIPSKIKTVTNLKTDQEALKQVKDFKDYRIILATLITAGRFTCPAYKGHFSYIFIDEASFATEPETLVPLVGQINERTRIILAGDPKQLDPVLKSEHARTFGYGVTLIERLMETNTEYRKSMVIKLLKNYRSHPAIIKIPNELFYEDELEVSANKKKYSRFCSWQHLPQKGFPVIFHSVVAHEEREKSDPSFFNLKEIEIIYRYIQKLLQTPGVSGSDIGIIATYKKQAIKISQFLEKKSIKNVTVGSVEVFLSSEKEIIIISTVRSSLNEETEASVGFLKNPRRFNVALTRAKALEIVVGNANALEQVPCWKSFITYCQNNNSFIEEPKPSKKKISRAEPTKKKPIKEEPTKEEPIKEEPTKEEPIKEQSN